MGRQSRTEVLTILRQRDSMHVCYYYYIIFLLILCIIIIIYIINDLLRFSIIDTRDRITSLEHCEHRKRLAGKF